MLIQANAKINLFLEITGKRDDGYHTLETVMQSVDLADYVTLDRDDKITMTCSDPTVPTDERNTCRKAARLFFEKTGISGGAKIHLDKRIPHGAGMGGGSADAAAVLHGLNELYERPLQQGELLDIAAKTGADVPFCLVGGTAMCRGIGEEITPISIENPPVFLIVKPDFPCDTPAAYALYDKSENIPQRSYSGGYYNVFRVLYNDERIDRIIEELQNSGASGAELTGSGSACFGAFVGEEAAMTAAKRFPECFTCVARPVGYGVKAIE